MIVTIHQPNFFPWLPFFNKMRAADVMIILNHCQWSKGGYQNRFRLGGAWHTMPVKQGLEPIADKEYVEPGHAWRRLKEGLPEYRSVLKNFDDCIGPSLSSTNTAIIGRIARLLGIRTALVSDTETGLTGSARLLDLCKRHGATTYLSGASGKQYLNEALFREAGVRVIYQQPGEASRRPILEVLADRARVTGVCDSNCSLEGLPHA